MKKTMAKLTTFILTLALVFSFAACAPDDKGKVTLSLNKTETAIEVGATEQLTVTKTPSDAAVTWASDKTDIATVSTEGLVTAVKVGVANVTVSSGDASATCVVTVSEKTVMLQLNKTATSIEVGKTEQLSVTVNPVGTAVTWESSKTDVATVSQSGLVTAVAFGTANITVSAGSVSKTCVVSVTKPADIVTDEGINISDVLRMDVQTVTEQTFADDKGIFNLGANAEYDAATSSIALSEQGYAYTKFEVAKMQLKYNGYGDKADRSGFIGNSAKYIRFKASGADSGLQIFGVNSEGDVMEVLAGISLTENSTSYQVEIPTAFSEKVCGLVFFNLAPADTGLVTNLEYFNVTDELDPKNLNEYTADMYNWMTAIDKGYEPMNFNPTLGWGGFYGISRGDMSGNDIVYLDSFGAALEYEEHKMPEATEENPEPVHPNLAFDGVSIFGKVTVPADAKKITYLIGHVGNPSAYRIRLYDGEKFVELTEGSNKVNTERVPLNQGWTLTTQAYNGTDTYEVAIPQEYQGKDVILMFSAKFNAGQGFGIRINNVAFSNEDVIVPPSIIDGINVDTVNALTTNTATVYDFANDEQNFGLLWGASYENGKIKMSGTTAPEGASANAAIASKMTLSTFKYLRFFASSSAGSSVDIRIRAIDFESKTGMMISDWTTLTGREEFVLQLQSFPTTFSGTVGLIIESKYTVAETAAPLFIDKVEFANVNRDENGYDLQAMGYIPHKAMPDDGKFTFGNGGNFGMNGFTTSDGNNVVQDNSGIWTQFNSTEEVVGECSNLTATKTTLGTYTTVEVKAGMIHSGGSSTTAFMRVRALLSDGTFVNFTKESVTDANGWFNGYSGTLANDYGWGGFYSNIIDVPAALSGQDCILIVEYNHAMSVEAAADASKGASWNLLVEHLQFS